MTGFLRSNWKFLTLLTVMLSVVAIALALLIPGQYTKQLNLSVRAIPTEIVVQLEQLPLTTVPELSNQAAVSLQGASLRGIEAGPRYNPQTQQVEVPLASDDKSALDEAGPEAVEVVEDSLRGFYEQRLSEPLETQLLQQEVLIEDQSNGLTEIERQIEQVTSAGGTEDDAQIARLEPLEVLRADAVTAIAQAQDKRNSFKQAQEDLSELAREVVSVELVSETETIQTRALPSRILLAIISALVLAILATIVRATATQGK